MSVQQIEPKPTPTLGELRARRGWTLDEVHVLTHGELDPATISRTERGLTEPRPETIVALARAYGMSAKTMRRVIEATLEATLGEGAEQ
jgi:transcriptional regulator with XRE-family HTH domain